MEYFDRSLEVSKLLKDIVFNLKNTMHKEFENAGIPGITPTQAMMIGILGREKKMRVSDLSRKMGLSNSTVSGIIDRLERQGVVERIRSGEDKRVVYISLSPNIKKMKTNIHARVEDIIEKLITEKGTPADFEKIIEGLNTLKRLLDSNRS